MKITGYGDSLSITLRSGRDLGSLLKGISAGDSVKAVIVSREGNIALLDMAGKRIRAEFTAGIPAENVITLILTEKNSESAIFRLVERESGKELQEFLKSNFLFSDKAQGREFIAGLARFLGKGSADLYSINLFLSGYKKDKEKESGITELINRLILRNVPGRMLNDLLLMAALRLPPPLLSALMYLMERNGKKTGIFASDPDSRGLSGAIEELPVEEGLYADILNLITGPGQDSNGYGDFPFPDGEGYARLDYIAQGDSLFLDFSLSALGRISALIRSGNNSVSIIIGSDRDDALKLLEEESRELVRSLNRNGIADATVSFHNTKKMIDKLRILCADSNNKSAFDIKI